MVVPPLTNRYWRWTALTLVSGIPRILGAFLLPNAFGDAYSYLYEVSRMSGKLSAGTFSITDLFGFWLPLYQFTCAAINVIANQPFYVAKLVSAVCGIGVCLLVYGITFRLTSHRLLSLAAFALIALNPLHILYSASSLTDVPHAFFVLASLYLVLSKQWVPSALLAALAGLTRVDSWMLLVLIPVIQIFWERRVSLAAIVILALPPLFWFYISWKARGDWLACFKDRDVYLRWLLAANPKLASFSLSGIAHDVASLLVSTDVAVFSACFIGPWLAVKRMIISPAERRSEGLRRLLAVSVYLFAFLGLLVFAYLTHRAPIIFPRYGLIFFTLGIPILAWTLLAIRQQKPQLARRFLVLVIALCVFDGSIELVGAIGFLNQTSAQQAVANYLHAQFQRDSDIRIFSDEPNVQALSGLLGIPRETFLSSADAPNDAEDFLRFLKEKNVKYLVFVHKEASIPARWFPDLAYGEQTQEFDPVMHSSALFLHTNIWVYRVRGADG
jgi:hypothetical protein